jgi:hypothetical protein
MLNIVSLNALKEPEEEVHLIFIPLNFVTHIFLQEPEADKVKPGPIKRLYNLINTVKELEEEPKIPEEPVKKTPEGNSTT